MIQLNGQTYSCIAGYGGIRVKVRLTDENIGEIRKPLREENESLKAEIKKLKADVRELKKRVKEADNDKTN